MKAQIPLPAVQFAQRFSATPRGARLARRLVLHQLDAWGFPHGGAVSEAVASVVAELAANAVTHGLVPGRDFEVRVECEGTEKGVLRIEVADARGERKLQLREESAELESGRGLWIVAELADAWGVRDRVVGKAVWADISYGEGRGPRVC
ncbi:ATP-binding protein [Streptomyces cavernicola]|uniref:ATP-binding protein n=1 Tax=Streptomyces cavernicola TaxID=3043613 RepID=A0ABT6SD18_9ACTN|nr:ATP-binding protein [Streptomyces sp. B-S-A6]MDI3405368.1 ATP-binding protein [Streptomyces sp. B-S-A6]